MKRYENAQDGFTDAVRIRRIDGNLVTEWHKPDSSGVRAWTIIYGGESDDLLEIFQEALSDILRELDEARKVRA